MLLASVPVGATCVADYQATQDTCCTDAPACESVHEPSGTNQPLHEDCCPSGCDDCFLQCCNGLLSLHAFSMTFDAHHPSRCTSLDDYDKVFLTDPKAIYHPPRS
jgi:hypothetical protein